MFSAISVLQCLIPSWSRSCWPSLTGDPCLSNECAEQRLAKYRDYIGVFHEVPRRGTAEWSCRSIDLELPPQQPVEISREEQGLQRLELPRELTSAWLVQPGEILGILPGRARHGRCSSCNR
jgi:hypothetical protein